ncbi:uncharacterized protein Dana_GF26293 [Drosophila ananassae]|uniref:Uncharacterized protein n=1 Tax=Drosophila ananassae TaxID=7217 RepID=A0A0P8XXX2_DROAN|nr:uncharacterized protein Dana_GF26293 [Drosophila ananassae]
MEEKAEADVEAAVATKPVPTHRTLVCLCASPRTPPTSKSASNPKHICISEGARQRVDGLMALQSWPGLA